MRYINPDDIDYASIATREQIITENRLNYAMWQILVPIMDQIEADCVLGMLRDCEPYQKLDRVFSYLSDQKIYPCHNCGLIGGH